MTIAKDRLIAFSSIVIVFIALLTSDSLAHPADGKTPADLPEWYGEILRLDSNDNYGRLQFVDRFPSPFDLTDSEKYIVAGTESSLLRGPGLRPWREEVLFYCLRVFNTTGSLPAVLDPDALGFDTPIGDAALSDILRSPISEEYPRLDSVEFSAGDLLVLPLTDEEMQHFAQHHDYWQDWYNDDGSKKDSLIGPVFYVRIYGVDQVIWQNLFYIRKGPKPDSQ